MPYGNTLTKEQIASAQTPQQMAASGVNGTPTITPSALTPAQPITPVTTPPVTPPVSPTLTAPAVDASATQPLPQESAIYKMMQDLQGNTNALGSETAFRTAQDAKYGVTEKQGLVTSLKTQFDDLTRQAEGIKLQQQQDIQNIQQAAQSGGANVTRGGIAPQERAMTTQRNQQLLTLGVQQNQIAAQHALASGDLATALSLSDRAVKMEYQPKKDALDAQRANIELLLKDPSLTLAQQKRAEDAKKANEEAQAKLTADTKDKETVQGLILQAVQNGAPAALIAQAQKDGTIFGTAGILTGYTAKETAASIQEYQYAKKNGYKGSFSDYQNEDANRKMSIARAGVANGEFGLSQGQANLFNNIVTKYNASPLIAAADRTIVLKKSIEQARTNPSDGATQLNLVYSYIQALDTYQSAVREGELGLVNSIDSKVGKLSNYVEQVQNGQIIRPEVAKQIADAAENLVNTINEGAKSKEKSYASQAETLGLGEPWKKYQSGFTSSFSDKTPQQKVEQAVKSSGKTYQQIISGAPKGQIAVVQDGVAGYIPVEEFDPNLYVRM